MARYDDAFYEHHTDAAIRSARALVPTLIEWLKPGSVVDVGCGSGGWLSVFRESGVADILGIDGEWIDLGLLEIPTSKFARKDLSEPIDLGRRFDLVMSLEVAEHLPPESAAIFVKSLTSLGDVILFSAAIPDQGGRHHVNEQWPAYWATLFAAAGYATLDCLRPRIWNRTDVEWYYAQNLLLFVRHERVQHLPAMPKPAIPSTNPLSLVHPRLFEEKLSDLRAWIGQIQGLADDLARIIAPGAPIIMADQGQLGRLATAGYRVSHFPNRDGLYGGPPLDDEVALIEFERVLAEGAEFMVIAWPAFWWLDHYPRFARRLRAAFSMVIDNARASVFDLRSELPDGP